MRYTEKQLIFFQSLCFDHTLCTKIGLARAETVDDCDSVKQLGDSLLQKRVCCVRCESSDAVENDWKQHSKLIVTELGQEVENRSQHLRPDTAVGLAVLQRETHFEPKCPVEERSSDLDAE